jgi:hypothetical protein
MPPLAALTPALSRSEREQEERLSWREREPEARFSLREREEAGSFASIRVR